MSSRPVIVIVSQKKQVVDFWLHRDTKNILEFFCLCVGSVILLLTSDL
jgi:hypothetical protein